MASLALENLAAGETLYRCHRMRHGPVHFGRRVVNRFDAPDGEFGVCYFSRSPAGAFAESFLRRARGQFIERDDLAKYGLSMIEIVDPVSLVQCHGPGLRRNGVDASISSGSDYQECRRFSLRCHDHPDRPDGIVYRARFDDDQHSIVLFERASLRIRVVPEPVAWIEAGGMLDEVLDRYEIGI